MENKDIEKLYRDLKVVVIKLLNSDAALGGYISIAGLTTDEFNKDFESTVKKDLDIVVEYEINSLRYISTVEYHVYD